SSLLWNCWPRLLDGSIKVSIGWFGEKVEVPDPRSEPRLRVFTRAFASAGTADDFPGTVKQKLKCLRPLKTLGILSLTKAAYSVDGARNLDEEHDERDAQHPLRHVAMMRGTRLIIHYWEGPMPPEGLQYAGVFLADEEVDAVYAASEPPAHDGWVKERLTGQDRTVVSVTYKRINEAIREFLQPSLSTPNPDHPADFGLLADQLGGLFSGVESDGAKNGPSDRGGTDGGEGGRGGTR